MLISEKALNEFIAIYKTEFGEELSRKDASEMAFRVLTIYELLARKLPGKTSTLLPRLHDDELPHDCQPQIGFRT